MQKEIATFRQNLQVGQEVVTAGGIYGKVKEIEDRVIVLEVSQNVKNPYRPQTRIYADAASNQAQAK